VPRIEADSVAEHVRQQTERLLDVSSLLFKTKGYRATDMGVIAAEMGLARSSLYRYYPNKDHILLACISRDMAPLLDAFEALGEKYIDPKERVVAWLNLQVDSAMSTDCASMALMSESRYANSELQTEIMALHQQPGRVLEQALGEFDHLTASEAQLLTKMIAGMTDAAVMHLMDQASFGLQSDSQVRDPLCTAVERIIGAREERVRP
jgi:AcrR family transcriptional regulator